MALSASSQVAIVGGGINGIALAWRFADSGHNVTLYERGRLASATSAASTKLLHGGLRYLEQASFGLVREALRERRWWLENAAHLAHPLAICVPIYKGQSRSRWYIKLGLGLYDCLAGENNLANHQWLDRDELLERIPALKSVGLQGGYVYYDGQMDDHQLALWAAAQAQASTAQILENRPVERVDTKGNLWLKNGDRFEYDLIVNASGPWAEQLLNQSDISSRYGLDLVRGSHIEIEGHIESGLLVQHPRDNRVIFILPYKGRILIGTTETPQSLNDPIYCTEQEKHYLIESYNAHMDKEIGINSIVNDFSGLRPLVRSEASSNKKSREYTIESNGRLLTIWGGKWTTARSLAKKVLMKYQNQEFSWFGV